MTTRKKKGIGFLITGGIFLGAGAIFLGTEVTPDWFALVVQGIGLIANLLGFVIVYPDTSA